MDEVPVTVVAGEVSTPGTKASITVMVKVFSRVAPNSSVVLTRISWEGASSKSRTEDVRRVPFASTEKPSPDTMA